MGWQKKETSALLILIYAAFYWGRLSKRQYLAYLILLFSVFVAIKGGLFLIFRDNPGELVEFHLINHNLKMATMAKVFRTSGYFVLLLILACFQWKRRPKFLRVALLCTLPPLFLLTLFLGYVDEWRDYYEAYPIVFALMLDFFLQLKSTVGNKAQLA